MQVQWNQVQVKCSQGQAQYSNVQVEYSQGWSLRTLQYTVIIMLLKIYFQDMCMLGTVPVLLLYYKDIYQFDGFFCCRSDIFKLSYEFVELWANCGWVRSAEDMVHSSCLYVLCWFTNMLLYVLTEPDSCCLVYIQVVMVFTQWLGYHHHWWST